MTSGRGVRGSGWGTLLVLQGLRETGPVSHTPPDGLMPLDVLSDRKPRVHGPLGPLVTWHLMAKCSVHISLIRKELFLKRETVKTQQVLFRHSWGPTVISCQGSATDMSIHIQDDVGRAGGWLGKIDRLWCFGHSSREEDGFTRLVALFQVPGALVICASEEATTEAVWWPAAWGRPFLEAVQTGGSKPRVLLSRLRSPSQPC